MSDIEFSTSDSDPVSDVDADEMAKLMAELDDIDDGLVKKPPKKTESSKQESSEEKKKVTFKESSGPSKKFDKPKSSPQKEVNWKSESSFAGSDNDRTEARRNTEPVTTSRSPRKSKKDLMADLFKDDDNDSHKVSPKKTPVRGETKTFGGQKQAPSRKAKDDISFDDDDDLLGSLDSKKKGSASDSSKGVGGGFLDSLLSSSEKKSVRRERATEFVLDDKYKNKGKENQTEDFSFGSYNPSATKPETSRGKGTTNPPSDDPFDIFSGSEPARRKPRSAPQRKPYEIDDDDILGNIPSRRRGSASPVKGRQQREQSPAKKENAALPGKQSESPGYAKKKEDDWLFGDSGGKSRSVPSDERKASLTPSKQGDVNQISPSKNEDWLGSLLISDKKSSSSKESLKQKSPSPLHSDAAVTPVHKTSKDVVLPSTHQSPGGPVTSPSVAVGGSAVPNVLQSVISTQDNSKLELLREQQAAQAAAMAAQMKAQQEALEAQMVRQLQQQQEQMAEALAHQQKMALLRPQDASMQLGTVSHLQSNLSDEELKKIQVDLHKAEVEVARLKSELELIHKQHTEEVDLLQESHRKKMDMDREVWERLEKRMTEERDSLIVGFEAKISSLQAEKDNLAASYETQLLSVKQEWSQMVDRTKELYAEMTERMKEEHATALQRMTHLKDLELKAAVSASGHAKEVEIVMGQLESNAANLSELTSSINSRHDTALEMAQRALKLKEKQLQDLENQLSASRAETESERGRLTALVQRLETTLTQQGSEVEKERWRLAQERLKLEVERQAMTEERRHLQMSTETERQNLAGVRESLMAEHRHLLQQIYQQKQEMFAQHKMRENHTLPHISSITAVDTSHVMNNDAEMSSLSCRLQEKLAALNHKEEQMKEEEERLEQLKFHLEQEKVKIVSERESLAVNRQFHAKSSEELEATKEEIKASRSEFDSRLSYITSHTQTLHHLQEKIEKEREKLEMVREEVITLAQLHLCPACQNRGGSEMMENLFNRTTSSSGDRHEQYNMSKRIPLSKADMSPASILARLAVGREQENISREKRLLKASTWES